MKQTIAAKLTAARQARDARQRAAASQPEPVRALRARQYVTVSHPARGAVDALVIHVETPAGLYPIAGAPDVGQVRNILAERHAEQLALLSYRRAGHDFCFCALTDGAGNWWDLQQQELSITEPQP